VNHVRINASYGMGGLSDSGRIAPSAASSQSD
jgi:hypothetical protein